MKIHKQVIETRANPRTIQCIKALSGNEQALADLLSPDVPLRNDKELEAYVELMLLESLGQLQA